MRNAGALAAVAVLGLVAASGAGPEAAGTTPTPASASTVPANFKLVIGTYGTGKTPIRKAEMVFVKGRAYLFVSEPALEVIIHDPKAERLEVLDLNRKIRAEVTLKKLQTFQANLHDAIAAACAKREAQGGRANQVAAAMSRDLIDPRLAAAYDPQTHRLRLTNPTVEIDAQGEPEPDEARLALIGSSLAAVVQLEMLRDPQGIPPFARLDALRVLTSEHRLRPTEMTFLYRLAGPPRKLRWTYRLVPELTDREVEAISRVQMMRDRCVLTRFERYERPRAR